MTAVPGTDGYGEAADHFARQYEALTFSDVHADVLPFFPPPPSMVVDIGAGSGRDAAALAELGHVVVAVEPTTELRVLARRLHAGVPVEWIDDALPDLGRLTGPFDLVLLTAVWMHLAPPEREPAMRRVSALLTPHGRAVISLRHGPVPAGRRMYDVSATETVSLARRSGLRTVHRTGSADLQSRSGVWWTTVVFEREGRPLPGEA